MNESNCWGKIYNFTNENLVAYKNIYDFNNAKVLSVIGSGDQYFSSLLYGAKKIDLYDINRASWDYFVLKYYAILTLTYEEFYNLFVTSNLDNIDIYNKVKYYLPKEVKDNLDKFIMKNRRLSLIMLKNTIYEMNINALDRIIPYFNIDKYYKLKNILEKQEVPNVYLYNLIDLFTLLSNNKYDLMLTSNIFHYLNISLSEYKNMLNNFNANIIQVDYYWLSNPKDKINDNCFDITEVESAFKNKKDYVLTLKKNNI